MKQINKIFVNTLPTTNTSGGMLTFLLELLHAFGKINNPKLNYCLICSEKNESLFRSFENYNNFSRIVVKVDNRNAIKRILYEQFMLPKILNAEKNAALLNICNVANFRCKIPQMTIIQVQLGIAKLRRSLPKKFVFISPLHKIYYDLFLERSLKRSTRTIAISNFMVKFLEEYKDKITVIHEGVNLDNFKTTAGSVDLNAPSYILSLSTLFPHKNMDRVIEAFNLFIKRTKANFNLMIVGKDPDGKQIPQLKELAKSLGIENRVIFKGRVPAEDIPALYANASLFLYLSSMEFFGLPVLEAMASDTPVIAANKMSIPEVVNDAGILVDPDDIESVSEYMEDILKNAERRNKQIELGRENIRNFTWQATAEKFEDLFLNLN